MKENKLTCTFRLTKETIDNIKILSQKLHKKTNMKFAQGEVIDLLVKNAMEKEPSISFKLI